MSVNNTEPQGEWEVVVGQAWRELFGLPIIRRDDNFFRLGGDSRMALQMITQLAIRCAVKMHVAVIFQYPTVTQLGGLIAELRSQDSEILI